MKYHSSFQNRSQMGDFDENQNKPDSSSATTIQAKWKCVVFGTSRCDTETNIPTSASARTLGFSEPRSCEVETSSVEF